MTPTIFISAGEASGEHYGALLIAALQKKLAAAGQSATFTGMGGPRMRTAGLDCVVRSEEMAVMGLTEVVRHLPHIWREFWRLKKAIRQRPPSVAVLIDFPEIHFRLAEEFHRLGVPVIFFVSPQLWAWKKKRIRLVQKYIDRMLVIFPFEEAFYRDHGVQAEFVGHPLAELPLPAVSREDFAAVNSLDPAKTWIGLLPGSRPKEIRDLLPTILQAAKGLNSLKGIGFSPYMNQPASTRALQATENSIKSPEASGHDFSRAANVTKQTWALAPAGPLTADDLLLQFIIPLAPTLNQAQRAEVRQIVAEHGSGLELRLIDDLGAEGAVGSTAGGARAALHHARASIVASGTATVEAALIGNPFVVVYRVSALTYAIAKRVVKVPHVAMANLIADKRVVPELIQDDFTAENIVQHIAPLLANGPARQFMMEELQRVRGLLAKQSEDGAIERVAEVTLEILGFVESQI
jgi:lipid-A-disaccharide synthase